GEAHPDHASAAAHLFDDDDDFDDDTQVMATQPVAAGQASARRVPLRVPRNWRRIGLITGGIALVLALVGGGTAWALAARMSTETAIAEASEVLADAEH